MVSFLILFSFMSCMFYSGGKGKNCSEYFNPQGKIISNLLSDMTTSNETCNYEIIAPVGKHVEILFDVNFRNQRRCSPMSTADYGIFISYTHTDQTRYYDVICDKKSAYLVRSVGRRLYLKFIINHVPFTYHGIYRFVPSTNCIMFQCLNGGTCIVTNGQRFCICPPGFSGFTCSECANFRCYNGGSCIMSKNNKPHCVCGINFEGRFCERNRNPCLSNPCLFGRCEIITSSDTSISSKTDGNEYSLPTGYNNLTNVTSKHIIYDQLNDILQEESHDSFQCTCYSGYSGVRCDQITEKCDSHSCLVHKECTYGVDNLDCYCGDCVFGLCVLVNDSRNCRCFPGFSGDNCSQNINECDQTPCVHGDCVDFVNRYVCSCNENYTGKTCNVSLKENIDHLNSTDDCSTNTCINGICAEQESFTACHCYTGFTGKRCEIPISFLVSTNDTFPSRQHRCFKKGDIVEICQCISKVCTGNQTGFQNTTVCKTLHLLSLLNEFCSEGNFSTVCVSYFDTSIVSILRLLCVHKQTNIPKTPDENNLTELFPFREKGFSQSSYLLRCTLSSSLEMTDVVLRPEATSLEFVHQVYVFSECYINITDHFEVSDCSIKTISFHFNMTWVSNYFKYVNIEMTVIEKLERTGTGTSLAQAGYFIKQTFNISVETLFMSFGNKTQFLETNTLGQVTYMCKHKCSESFCKKKTCELDKMTPEYQMIENDNNANHSSLCTCPMNETGDLCQNTKDNGGKKTQEEMSYTFVYLIISFTIMLIVLIPGSACICIKQSRKRGKAEFPELLYSPSALDTKVLSKGTRERSSDDVEQTLPKLMTSRDIFMENKKKLFLVDGAETGKSEA